MYEKLGLVDRPTPTGDAAFRACIPIDKVEDPEIREFMSMPRMTRWLGPGCHIQAYPIRHSRLYNLVRYNSLLPYKNNSSKSSHKVMCHPEPDFMEESWTAKASAQDLIGQFGSWDNRYLRKIINLIPEDRLLVWRLCVHDPLPKWVMGRVVMLGDACHPMLPYIGQGGAQAIEDVAVLDAALRQLSTTDDIPVLLQAYEYARKSRAEQALALSSLNREVLHLPDGPEQQDRDRRFAAVAQGGENPDLMGRADIHRLLYDHDPEKEFLDNAESESTPIYIVLPDQNTRSLTNIKIY